MLWVWSMRLTHSYFRREEWNFGAREDWRFTEYHEKFGRHWWWMSFFVAYLSQQPMLVGLTVPIWYAVSVDAPWSWIDSLATAGAILGLVVAYFADTQLREFMVENERREAAKEPKVLILDSGVWHYSRHPNYFGEQLWWWSLALFAVRLGHPWAILGTAFNSVVLAIVTGMTEARMLRNPARADLYRAYQQQTSILVPWFKFSARKDL